MVAPAVQGIDLFKIAGLSISGGLPSLKTGVPSHVRQPFCSQLEERLLMYLEYHPQVAWYARGDSGPQFATTYRLPTPKDASFAIGYVYEGQRSTFDASTLESAQREQFHRNLRAVEQVRACAPQTRRAAQSGIPRSTLSRLVQRVREKGQIGCRPHGSYARKTAMHPALQRWAMEKTIWEVVGGERK